MRLLAALFALTLSAQEAYQLNSLRSERITVAQGGYFPRMAILPSGDLLAFFKTGAPHIGKGGRASMSRSTDGGKTWSAPVTMFDRPNADDGVDSTGVTRSGALLTAAVSYSWKSERYSYDGWTADGYFLRSEDGGRKWSAPVKVNAKPLDWVYPFGQILEESDGTLLLTGYGGALPMTATGEQITFVVRSKDGGKTWGDYSEIARGYNEITLTTLRDGALLAVMRSVVGAHMDATVSHDRGRTWSKPRQITQDREHPPDLLRLANGALLLTFGERNKPYGIQAMISRDEGKTWDRDSRVILAWDGDHSDLGYPITVQRKDGRLVTIYYIVYGERDPEGLKGIAPKNAFTKAIIWDAPASWR